MPEFFVLLGEHIEYFPLFAFLGLLLAGCNLPVSEDLIIITAALLSHEEPSIMIPSLLAIFAGVVATDFFMYWVGGKARSGASRWQFFVKMAPRRVLDKIHLYLGKYGIFTFIIGRFIPFGFRNTMFFTSGFMKLRLREFIIYDLVAAAISVNTLFFVVYRFGENARKPLKIAGIVMFIFAVSSIISIFVRFVVVWRRKKAAKAQAGKINPPCHGD